MSIEEFDKTTKEIEFRSKYVEFIIRLSGQVTRVHHLVSTFGEGWIFFGAKNNLIRTSEKVEDMSVFIPKFELKTDIHIYLRGVFQNVCNLDK